MSHHGHHCKVLLANKNFQAHNPHVSHIGLGVALLNISKVLKQYGVSAKVKPVATPLDLEVELKINDYTHAVVAAPWIPIPILERLCMTYHDTQFYVNSHSNVGFLQADANGVRLIREGIDLEQRVPNFHMAGNSRKFVKWARATYQCPFSYLPNLYYLDYSIPKPRCYHLGETLRVGAFGAVRPGKNLMTSAGAATALSSDLRVPVELWISGGRIEGESGVLLRAVENLVRGTQVTLKTLSWANWSQFRDTIGTMHVVFQPSYTESFNMVCADAVAQGVPVVVSDAIDWLPEYFQADMDNALDIARHARRVLFDPFAATECLQALIRHNKESVQAWMSVLGLPLPTFVPIAQEDFVL